MKAQLLLAIAMIASMPSSAKDKVVTRPAFANGGIDFCPRTVIRGKKATTIGFVITGRSSQWTMSPDAHLVADSKTYRMSGATVFTRTADGTVTGSEAYSPQTIYWVDRDSISMDFEPLDPKTLTFDFIETETSSFNVYGIRLDGKYYPFVLGKPKQYTYPQEEPLCALEPRYARAGYTCTMHRHDGTESEVTRFGLNNCFSKDRYMGFSDNGYHIEASCPYYATVAAPYPAHQFIMLMVPGYETTAHVDETAYLASFAKAGRKPIPTQRIIQFEGPLADLQQVLYDERWLYHQFKPLSTDTLWNALQDKIRKIEANKDYTRRQKDFGRLWAERTYLQRYVECVGGHMTELRDEHAPDLAILKDGRSFYLINNDKFLAYANANGIDGVVTQWMEGYAKAQSMARRMQRLELMSDDAFDTIPQHFRKELRDMNDSTRVTIANLRDYTHEMKVMDTPDCTGEEFIDMVVQENPGVVLFFDFWATWCGPCMRGIWAMEPLKKEWAGRPIRFVYVTNESSPANQWSQQIASMNGIHYRLPDKIWKTIPGLRGIPQYYIYDRHGKRFYEQTGFGVIDPLKQKIEDALEQ